MQFKQLYFTSCQVGIEQSPGFQIKSMTKDMEDFITDEIKKMGKYQVPKDYIYSKSNYKLPIAFRYKQNNNGTFIIHSVYTGKDFLGDREGNYFLHGLYSDTTLNFYLIDLYDYGEWTTKYAKDNFYLDLLEINDINVAYTKTINDDNLVFLLKAIFLSKGNGRKIVIRDNNTFDGIRIIQHVLKFLPISIANGISFSSYQYDPRDIYDINIVFGETEFLFDYNEYNYDFYIFDLNSKQYSEIEDIDSEFINLISTNKDLNNFNIFLNYFEIMNLESLDNTSILYNILFNESTSIFIEKSDRFIDLLKTNLKHQYRINILELFRNLSNKKLKFYDYNELYNLCCFLQDLNNIIQSQDYNHLIMEILIQIHVASIQGNISVYKFQGLYDKVKPYQYKNIFDRSFSVSGLIDYMDKVKFINFSKNYLAFENDDFISMYIDEIVEQYLKNTDELFPLEIIDLFDNISLKHDLFFKIVSYIELNDKVQENEDYLLLLLLKTYSKDNTYYYDSLNRLSTHKSYFKIITGDLERRIEKNYDVKLYLKNYKDNFIVKNNLDAKLKEEILSIINKVSEVQEDYNLELKQNQQKAEDDLENRKHYDVFSKIKSFFVR